MEDTLLEVRDLQVEFSTKMGIVRVLDKVNLKVDPRQTVGIIGESGCGKSMMALSIMGLVPIPPGRIAGGEILYRGTLPIAIYSMTRKKVSPEIYALSTIMFVVILTIILISNAMESREYRRDQKALRGEDVK